MSTEKGLHRIALNGPTMGTRYSCVFYARKPDGYDALGSILHQGISGIDQIMSNWKSDSAISQLNAEHVGVWHDIPESLMDVLEASLIVEAASNGSFDIGVGREVAEWGFGPMAAEMPSSPLAARKRAQTRSNLELDRVNMRVRKHADLTLDLSGIAKGYGVDHLGSILTDAGVESWLVGLDGEIRGKGTKPDGSAWAIAHERPIPGHREIMGVIEVNDLAVATSGTYRHFRNMGDRTVSHTIDPIMGCPIPEKLASVTILAATCMEADAWATAVLVDGHWPPKRFSTPVGIEALLSC